VTDDEAFFQELKEKWDVVMFAPGACRWSASKQPIPGSGPATGTSGWGLEQYRAKVRAEQGEQVPIVETTEEREIIPRLKAAFGSLGGGREKGGGDL